MCFSSHEEWIYINLYDKKWKQGDVEAGDTKPSLHNNKFKGLVNVGVFRYSRVQNREKAGKGKGGWLAIWYKMVIFKVPDGEKSPALFPTSSGTQKDTISKLLLHSPLPRLSTLFLLHAQSYLVYILDPRSLGLLASVPNFPSL